MFRTRLGDPARADGSRDRSFYEQGGMRRERSGLTTPTVWSARPYRTGWCDEAKGGTNGMTRE